MLNKSYNPDILSCLANLSSDEVFTPPKLANEILDQLPSEIWEDKNARFLDPASKSGVFLREIAKRLNAGLKNNIPVKQERLNHIFRKQIYGLSTSELSSMLSRRSVYCTKKADGKYSVCEEFSDEQGNVIFNRAEHLWAKGKCSFCRANQETYERDEEMETYAYPFIHTDDPEDIFSMKFDVIIGNPPYQLQTQKNSRQATPIYHRFVEQALKLKPRFLTMIIPSRWFAGGMGLNEFRSKMLNDDQLRTIVDHIDSRDCFSGVDVAGGVCYFLWERDTHGDCKVVSRFKNSEYESKRPLNEFKTFIRFAPAVSILRKVTAQKEDSFRQLISAVKPFGLATKDRPDGKGGIQLVSSAGTGKISSKRVTKGHDMVDKWKVMTSKTSHDHAGQPDKEGMRRVLSRAVVLKPRFVCTESYIILGAFDQKKRAQYCLEYATTRFVRFLVSLVSFSQDITRERFVYVPIQDFTKSWSDEKLYKKYGLSKDEIAFIESTIRPMEVK